MMRLLRRTIGKKETAAGVALAGMLVFAVFVHGGPVQFTLALCGLTLTAATIGVSAGGLSSLLALVGLRSFDRATAWYSLAGLGIGVCLAVICRLCTLLGPFPAALTPVAGVVPLVGITEELLFRGYLQSALADRGPLFSIAVSTLGHTLYKYLVLRSLPPGPVAFDFPLLAALTFAIGLVFGLLRSKSNSILPPALAHGVFDMLVYGGLSSWPPWVWG
jgi:membrane protease YdiL (CAAX protease family)